MVLEHDADVAVLWKHVDVGRRVVENQPVDDDPSPLDGNQPGQGPQQGRLARPVGPDHGEHRIGDLQLDVEVERPESECYLGVERQLPPSQRSRSATRTIKETTA